MDRTTNWSFPSNLSLYPELYFCTDSRIFIFYTALGVTKTVFILPFAILVLYVGHHRWRQQRSFNTMSQSDLMNYHIAFMQLFWVPGLIIYICGFYVQLLFLVGVYFQTLVTTGELLFHVLTCVERYLAVVHPITYLQLKNTKGTKIRRFCVGGVWLFFFGWIIPVVLYAPGLPVIPFFCLLTLCFAIVSFCSLSVLRALIRPGPGEVAGKKERVDQTKQKAFQTIMVITGGLWFLCTGCAVCIGLGASELLNLNENCWVGATTMWFCLPSSLFVPLLFLHTAGKLRCCCVNADK